MPNHIGTLSEKSLHHAIKRYYFRPGDQLEVPFEGYVIDILRGNGEGRQTLIEIQTRNFSSIKNKLEKLLSGGYRVRLVHPIAFEKWILREDKNGKSLSRRKSPKKGRWLEIYKELLRIPDLLPFQNLAIDVVLTRQEEVRRDDGQGSWRRKGWSLADHRLLEIVETRRLRTREDYFQKLVPGLARPFTNRALAEYLGISANLAGKITYTLRKAGWLEQEGKKSRAYLFTDSF